MSITPTIDSFIIVDQMYCFTSMAYLCVIELKNPTDKKTTIRALAENFYRIKECIMFKAVGLDIDGADEEQILLEWENEIQAAL